MTTQDRRWFRGFGFLGMAVFLAVLTVAGLAQRAAAQPYAAVLMDARTGEILSQTDNATARLHPASLTKMMTLYIAFEALENGEITEDTRVRISRHAAAQPPSRLGLRAGQTIAFRYLVRAAALRSGNDAAVAIAEALEGSVSSFAARMNRTARAIGMTRTNFVNPHGLTAATHLSSARDMAILGRQLYFDFPDYYNLFSRLSDNAGIATVRNTNRLFLGAYRGADGIKTGFTNAAGYNLAAMAERDGVRLLAVVFGARSSQDRLQRVSGLLDRGFRDAPRRVALRRPARPDYVRGSDDRGGGVAAGRTIRLQTAPTSSRFPRPRSQPGEVPAPELLAALREVIDEVIEEIREPDPLTDTDDPGVAAGVTSEEPEDATALASATESPPDAAEAVALAAVAPEHSPLPRARPEVQIVTLVPEVDAVAAALAEAETPAEEGPGVEVARASGFTLIDAGQYAALVESGVELPPESEAMPLAALPAPSADPDPQRFEHDPDSVAAVAVTGAWVTIPGLPPIPLESGENSVAASESETAPAPATATEIAAAPEPSPETPLSPALEPETPELAVDGEGRILWRDEELLQALEHENPEEPVLQPTIVLTSADDVAPAATAAPMPEIVTRVSTSGGRVWRVELGRFGSSYDADRALLGVALSEAATLGRGVRRVVSRGGRYVAEVQSLTQEEAELACLRLTARNQSCEAAEVATN